MNLIRMLRPSNDDDANLRAALIDELGRIREEKSRLETSEKFLRDQILALHGRTQ
ncbi:hypothetical protein IB024_13660 [Brucella sp. 6810]|uniref:hypothetical protein n=1 Tax=Brucella sp. 6810 TaxID=2769351 RepID=UPI00165A706E|nr:hypothetical protein [Brucella sp. 6810]QNQ64326.1 hypothetical protein IB024_13660 [Brucella sp. 6810]